MHAFMYMRTHSRIKAYVATSEILEVYALHTHLSALRSLCAAEAPGACLASCTSCTPETLWSLLAFCALSTVNQTVKKNQLESPIESAWLKLLSWQLLNPFPLQCEQYLQTNGHAPYKKSGMNKGVC